MAMGARDEGKRSVIDLCNCVTEPNPLLAVVFIGIYISLKQPYELT